MPAWLAPLLRLLELVAERIRRARKRREQEAHQDDVDRLQDDPVEFGRDHFNRVRDNADVSGDAGASSHANTAELESERTGRSESGSARY